MTRQEETYGDFLELVIAHKIYHILNPHNQEKFPKDIYTKSDTPYVTNPSNKFNPEKIGLNNIISSGPKKYILEFNGKEIEDTVQAKLNPRTRIKDLNFFKKDKNKYNSIVNIDISKLRQIKDIIQMANQYLLNETMQELVFTVEMTGINIPSNTKSISIYKKADLTFNLNVKFKYKRKNEVGDEIVIDNSEEKNHKYSVTLKLSDSSWNKKIQQGLLDGSFKDKNFSEDKLKPLLKKLFFEVAEEHENLDQEYINFKISNNEIHTISKPIFFEKINSLRLDTIETELVTLTTLTNSLPALLNNKYFINAKNKVEDALCSLVSSKKKNILKQLFNGNSNNVLKEINNKPLFIKVSCKNTSQQKNNILNVRLENRYYFAAVKCFSVLIKQLLARKGKDKPPLSKDEVKKLQNKQKEFENYDLNTYIYEYGNYIKDKKDIIKQPKDIE